MKPNLQLRAAAKHVPKPILAPKHRASLKPSIKKNDGATPAVHVRRLLAAERAHFLEPRRAAFASRMLLRWSQEALSKSDYSSEEALSPKDCASLVISFARADNVDAAEAVFEHMAGAVFSSALSKNSTGSQYSVINMSDRPSWVSCFLAAARTMASLYASRCSLCFPPPIAMKDRRIKTTKRSRNKRDDSLNDDSLKSSEECLERLKTVRGLVDRICNPIAIVRLNPAESGDSVFYSAWARHAARSHAMCVLAQAQGNALSGQFRSAEEHVLEIVSGSYSASRSKKSGGIDDFGLISSRRAWVTTAPEPHS